MSDMLTRIGTDLIGRLTGPLSFRVFLQPAMATLLAARDGFHDARAGRPPYLWTIISDAGERRRLLRDGWKDVGKVVGMAIVMDLVYQLIVFRRIYPDEAIDVGIILAILPYALLRGPFNRLARFRRRT